MLKFMQEKKEEKKRIVNSNTYIRLLN